MILARQFISLLGGAAAAWPVAARGQQQAAKPPQIGLLAFGTASAWAPRVEALQAGLRDRGYVEGKNIAIEFRWAETVDLLAKFAAELVRMNVDLILAPSSTEVEAARQATKTIPIVFAVHADPVGVGHVASLPRPGGNITGLSMLLTDLAAKELEILREVVPHAARIGVLFNPTAPSHRLALQAVQTASEKLGVALRMVPVQSPEEFDAVFAAMAREGVGAFLVFGLAALFLSADASGRSRSQAPVARHVRHEGDCGGGWPHELCAGSPRPDAASRNLHRQDPKGRQTSRPARGASFPISASHQPQDSEVDRPRNSADSCCAPTR